MIIHTTGATSRAEEVVIDNAIIRFSIVNMYSVIVLFNTSGATSGAGTAYPSGAPEFTPDFFGVHVALSLVLCVCFVDRYFSFFFWPFVLSVLRFMGV